jgi:hypothetical protein
MPITLSFPSLSLQSMFRSYCSALRCRDHSICIATFMSIPMLSAIPSKPFSIRVPLPCQVVYILSCRSSLFPFFFAKNESERINNGLLPASLNQIYRKDVTLTLLTGMLLLSTKKSILYRNDRKIIRFCPVIFKNVENGFQLLVC